MFGMDHESITVKSIDGEEFLFCSDHGCGLLRDRWSLEFGRFGHVSAFVFLCGFWQKDLELLRDFVFSLDSPGQHIEFGQSPTAPLYLSRVEEALEREEVLVYALGDPDEAALKALRQQIHLTLAQILAQERAEAARLLIQSTPTLGEQRNIEDTH